MTECDGVYRELSRISPPLTPTISTSRALIMAEAIFDEHAGKLKVYLC